MPKSGRGLAPSEALNSEMLTELQALAKADKVGEALRQLQILGSTMKGTDKQYLYSKTIKFFADSNKWQGALELLLHMHQHGPKPNLVCHNATMSALVHGQRPQKALEVLALIKDTGFRVDNFTCSSALKALAMLKRSKDALDFLHSMPTMGVEPNHYAYCAAINACERGGQWKEALGLFELMKIRGIKVNAVICASVISACKVGGQWQQAVDILISMDVELGLMPDAHCYTNAISACDHAGKWRDAKALWDHMKRSGVVPTMVSYGAMLSAYETGSQWSLAVKLLEEMPMTPDRVCFSTVASACAKAGQHQLVKEISTRAHALGHKIKQPSMKSVERNTGVAQLTSTSSSDHADQYHVSPCHTMSSTTPDRRKCDGWIWPDAAILINSSFFKKEALTVQGTLLSEALCAFGEMGAWEQALNVYFELNSREVSPSEQGLHAASTACQHAGQYGWGRVFENHADLLKLVDADM